MKQFKNILILMAGRGSRFLSKSHKNSEYKKPKPMIEINGKSILKRTMESLPDEIYSRANVYYAILQQHVNDWNIHEFVKSIRGGKTIIFPRVTRGNLDTAMKSMDSIVMAPTGGIFTTDFRQLPLLVLDSDNQYDGSGFCEFISFIEDGYFGQDFIILAGFKPLDDSDKWCVASTTNIFVNGIREKDHPRLDGDRCMVGVFYFSSTDLFIKLSKIVQDDRDQSFLLKPAEEFYMSEAVSVGLRNDVPVFIYEVNDMVPLGTPNDIEKIQPKRTRDSLIFCFDLDGTICKTKGSNEEYGNEEPLPGAIDKLKELKENGHYIIIQTARHMKTCNGNVGKVMAKQGKTTIDWLEKHGVPYDELFFGKPHYDFLIDDKALNHKADGDWEETSDNIDKLIFGGSNE